MFLIRHFQKDEINMNMKYEMNTKIILSTHQLYQCKEGRNYKNEFESHKIKHNTHIQSLT